MPSHATTDLFDLHARASRGDVAAVERGLGALRGDDSPSARAWTHALRLAGWLAAPSGAPPVDVASLAACAAEDAAAVPAVARALADAAALAFVRMDADALAGVVAAFPPERPGEDVATAVLRGLVGLYREAAALPTESTPEHAEAVAAQARAASLGGAVVAAHSLGAYALLRDGNAEAARAVARRASRMARAEELPQVEYLANVILARTRRLTGHPHLAARILLALAELVPAPWRPWLAWELTLAGHGPGWEPSAELEAPFGPATPRARALAALRALLHAAGCGDAAAYDAALEALGQAVVPVPVEARELAAIVAATDVRVNPHQRPVRAIEAWLRGAEDEVPPVIAGLSIREVGDGTRTPAAACLVVSPTDAPRRVVPLAAPLALALRRGTLLRTDGRNQERTESVAAMLLSVGAAGLKDEELYERSYRVPYERAIHRGALDTLLHRVRAWLGAKATMVREQGRVHLAVAEPFAIYDLRCAAPLSDRILQVVAEQGDASAKDVADRLDVPLRTVQTALRELAEDGAFEVSAEGRKHLYRIVDTTFSPPTQH